MKHPALRRLAEKIQNLPIKELLEESAAQVRQVAADLQREQMMDGENAEGNAIEPFYTPFTKRIKASKGQPTDRVTLKDTGAFHNSIFAEAESEGIQFGARDSKTRKLKAKYGESGPLFGLNKVKRITLTQEHLKPLLQRSVKMWWHNR